MEYAVNFSWDDEAGVRPSGVSVQAKFGGRHEMDSQDGAWDADAGSGATGLKIFCRDSFSCAPSGRFQIKEKAHNRHDNGLLAEMKRFELLRSD